MYVQSKSHTLGLQRRSLSLVARLNPTVDLSLEASDSDWLIQPSHGYKTPEVGEVLVDLVQNVTQVKVEKYWLLDQLKSNKSKSIHSADTPFQNNIYYMFCFLIIDVLLGKEKRE